MIKTIPKGAFQYKEGLYVLETPVKSGPLSWTVWELYSAEGYCFYDLTQPENYVDGDVEGELLPLEKRVFAQYMTMCKDEEYVTNNIISVPIEDGYENVSEEDHIDENGQINY